jgi:hypothetical protein
MSSWTSVIQQKPTLNLKLFGLPPPPPGGATLSPLGLCASLWPIAPGSDNRNDGWEATGGVIWLIFWVQK